MSSQSPSSSSNNASSNDGDSNDNSSLASRLIRNTIRFIHIFNGNITDGNSIQQNQPDAIQQQTRTRTESTTPNNNPITRIFEHYNIIHHHSIVDNNGSLNIIHINHPHQQLSSRNIFTIEPIYATIRRASSTSSSNQQSTNTLTSVTNSNNNNAQPQQLEETSSSAHPNTSSSITSTTNTATDTLNHGHHQTLTGQQQQTTTIITGLVLNDDSGGTGGEVDSGDSSMETNDLQQSTTNQPTESLSAFQQNNNSPEATNNRNQNRPVSVTINHTFNIHQHRSGDHHQSNQQQNNPNNPFGGDGLEFMFDANLLRARQRVYSMLLIRIALSYSVSMPKFLRNFFEYSILLMAFICFALLIHMHVIFIRSPLTCLDHVKHTWPKHGILRVQIGGQEQLLLSQHKHNLTSGQLTEPIINVGSNVSTQTMLFPVTYDQYRKLYYDIVEDSARSGSSFLRFKNISMSKTTSAPVHYSLFNFHLTAQDNDESSLDDESELTFFNYKKNGAWSEPYIVEYSLEYGLLRLSEKMRDHYHVPVMKVVLNPETNKCFGDWMARFMLNNFLGYDDVLIGSIKQLAEYENNRGFVRNVVTGEHFRFVNVWMTRTSYLAAAFIMIIFTLFVSMLIRYSHQQVFVFVSEFLRSLELQQPATRISFLAASLVTVILALIGMETIMYEFFSDSSITFHVIIMVWAADQFDSLAIHSRITRRHFLRFFYLYQFIFYAYHYRFNGQYSGLALLTTMLFTYHSMIYFFHHFELSLLRAAYLQQNQPLQRQANHNYNQNSENTNDDPNIQQQQGHNTLSTSTSTSNSNNSNINSSYSEHSRTSLVSNEIEENSIISDSLMQPSSEHEIQQRPESEQAINEKPETSKLPTPTEMTGTQDQDQNR